MKSISYFLGIVFILLSTLSCQKQEVVKDIKIKKPGKFFILENFTGHAPELTGCGEPVKAKFILTSPKEQKRVVLLGDSYVKFNIEIEEGEPLHVKVIDTETGLVLIEQNYVLNSPVVPEVDAPIVDYPLISLCPKDQLTFVNF